MQRFLVKLFKFLFFAFGFYVFFVILWGTFVPSAYTKNLNYRDDDRGFLKMRLSEADTFKNVDVLCLGSSHAFRGLDPRIFQKERIRMFNLGSNAQTPIETEYFLNKYLGTLNPKLVIFDAYPSVFESDGVESLIDLLSNGVLDKKALQLCFKINSIKGYNSYIYSFFEHLLNFSKSSKVELQNDDVYISGGYVQSNKKNKKETNFTPETYQFAKKQLEAFDRIINIFHRNHINYILLQAPIMQNKYNFVLNNNSIDSLFSLHGFYYNFNKILKLDDSCFSDTHHLNQNGVDIYNKELIKVLQRDKKLPTGSL